MKFQHRDGADSAAGSVSLGPVRDKAKLDSDGIFAVDDDREDFDAVRERLESAGHTPVDETGGEETEEAAEDEADEPADEAASEAEDEAPRAADYTEEELVAMGRNELRSIAGSYDNINGNASGDKLTEELIEQRRSEVDE